MRSTPHRGAARATWSACACALLLAGLPVGVTGQAPETIVSGQVHDTEGFPLPRAEVHVLDLDVKTLTNDDGLFDLGRVPAGTHYLLVWAPGHQSIQATLELAGGDSVTLAVTLKPGSEGWDRADARDEQAREERVRERRQRTGFAARRAGGGGFFLTREEFADEQYESVAEILRRVPGLRTAVDSYGRVSMSARGAASLTPRGRCDPVFFLDGVATSISPAELSGIPAEHVDALEVYRGASELPPRFNVDGAMCGVVAIWTR